MEFGSPRKRETTHHRRTSRMSAGHEPSAGPVPCLHRRPRRVTYRTHTNESPSNQRVWTVLSVQSVGAYRDHFERFESQRASEKRKLNASDPPAAVQLVPGNLGGCPGLGGAGAAEHRHHLRGRSRRRRPVLLQLEVRVLDAAARSDGRRGHSIHGCPQPVHHLLTVAVRPLLRPADLPRRPVAGAARSRDPAGRASSSPAR